MSPETEQIYTKIKSIAKEITDLDQQLEGVRREYIFAKNRVDRIQALIDMKRRQLFSLKQGQINFTVVDNDRP